jgi:hypothetical protein
VNLYIHFPIRLHGVVVNQLSTGTTFNFYIWKLIDLMSVMDFFENSPSHKIRIIETPHNTRTIIAACYSTGIENYVVIDNLLPLMRRNFKTRTSGSSFNKIFYNFTFKYLTV